jgi:hypothetical protein
VETGSTHSGSNDDRSAAVIVPPLAFERDTIASAIGPR